LAEWYLALPFLTSLPNRSLLKLGPRNGAKFVWLTEKQNRAALDGQPRAALRAFVHIKLDSLDSEV
jgi:hypothetical protein